MVSWVRLHVFCCARSAPSDAQGCSEEDEDVGERQLSLGGGSAGTRPPWPGGPLADSRRSSDSRALAVSRAVQRATVSRSLLRRSSRASTSLGPSAPPAGGAGLCGVRGSGVSSGACRGDED